MNVLQHTRNERNPCLKHNRPDRSYRDTLLSLKLTRSTLLSTTEHHTLTHIPSPQVSSSKSPQHFSNLQFFCPRHLLITGDFNIQMDVEADTGAVRLRELLESTGLKQHVTAPTHISGHTLDLIITRLSDQLDISSVQTCP